MNDLRAEDPLRERLSPEQTPAWSAGAPLEVESLRALFDSRSGFTVGIEEELMLLDPATLQLTPAVDLVLDRVGANGRFGYELRQGQVEIRTPVSGSAVAAGIVLADSRLQLAESLDGLVAIAAAGTHPFSKAWGDVTEGERYLELADVYPSATHGNLPSGLHVHVAVPGADRALAVFNAARSYLPELSALAANSPFLDGRDSGLASARSQLALAHHRAGVPPCFRSWAHFVELVEWGRRGGLLADASHLWWDLRPHARFGTLELRVADAQTRVEDATAIAAVYHCLLAFLAERHDESSGLAAHEATRIAENSWSAARYGTRGWMVDLETGERQETRARISQLLDTLAPTADSLGATWALLTARALVADNGSDRQRYVAERDGLAGLVRWLSEETVSSARDYLERRS